MQKKMIIEHPILEIIKKVGTLDRTQVSNSTKKCCQFLLDHIKSFTPSASFRILEFTADKDLCPLGFTVPSPWELITGNISFSGDDSTSVTLDHSCNPMLVATNSRAFTGSLPVCDLNETSLEGKLVLLNGPKEIFPDQLDAAIQGNAAGIASAAFSRHIGQEESRARIELPSRSCLFALSLTHSEYESLSSAHDAGMLTSEVNIITDLSGTLPVLEIRTHPDAQKEILLCAHICHLRPGANDNASGVAVLCELLRTAAGSLPPVRLIFAPELTGMSSYLAASNFRPVFVVNLDMIGGDPLITGAQLELECSPPYLHHPLQDLLIELLNNASELKCCVKEFKGYSDHALFASKAIAVPAVLIGQTGDIYNHTDLDRIENLCLNQMKNICKLLTQFLIKATPFYETSNSSVESIYKNDALPFNIYTLLNVCNEDTKKDILIRLTKDKNTYARLQKAYLNAQWGLDHGTDSWAKGIISGYLEFCRRNKGGLHD